MTTIDAIPKALHVNSNDLPYVELGDGSSIRLLHADIENGLWVVDTVFKPGTVLQRHKHTGSVHAFTKQGMWKYLEYQEVNTPGSYLFEPAGSIHTLTVPQDNTEDTIVNFVISGANLYLDENDQVTLIVDAAAVKFIYDLLAKEQGYEDLKYINGGKYSQSN